MNESNNQSEQSKVSSVGIGLTGRRSFVRGVGLIVPTVLTVGSRSAMATVGCLSPSASASINLSNSRPGRSDGSCANGRTPGYWKNAATNHHIYTARNNQFSSVYLNGFPGKTMEDVCNLGGGSVDPYEFGAHLAAAWCNLSNGWVDASVLSLLVLQTMWAQGNNYHPVPGVTWSKEQIVTYLKTTMPL